MQRQYLCNIYSGRRMEEMNHGFKRFRLKGNMKVNVEFGLVALAHNLRKYAKHLSNIKPETTPPEATAMALCADCLPDCAA